MIKPIGSVKEHLSNERTINIKLIRKLRDTAGIETARQRILQLLFYAPQTEFALSEVAEYAGVSKSTGSRIVLQLNRDGFVDLVQRPLIWRIRANSENPSFKREKMLYNLAIIYRSGLVEYIETVSGHPKNIILFGSFSKGEDIPGSDIDIAIESESGKAAVRIKELDDFGNRVGRKVKIHVFNRKTVDINLFNSIANGIVLSGFLEVKK